MTETSEPVCKKINDHDTLPPVGKGEILRQMLIPGLNTANVL